jgi:hypothetical protein
MRPTAKFKVRKVVREFRIPSPVNPAVMVPREELECGHIIRGRRPSGEKAKMIQEVFRIMAGKPTRRRCFECGKENQ